MRAVRLHPESPKEFFDDDEHGGPSIPILALAQEYDPDPDMRTYKNKINLSVFY